MEGARGRAVATGIVTATLAIAMACADATPAAGEPTLFATSAWARPADSGATAALYFTLENRDTIADTLTGVRSDAADEVALHVSMQQGRTMHMTAVRALPVPARDSVMFRPLGAHVMLMGLRAAAAPGDTLRAVLTFASGDTTVVAAHVRTP